MSLPLLGLSESSPPSPYLCHSKFPSTPLTHRGFFDDSCLPPEIKTIRDAPNQGTTNCHDHVTFLSQFPRKARRSFIFASGSPGTLRFVFGIIRPNCHSRLTISLLFCDNSGLQAYLHLVGGLMIVLLGKKCLVGCISARPAAHVSIMGLSPSVEKIAGLIIGEVFHP
jgi:hypothetical protein